MICPNCEGTGRVEISDDEPSRFDPRWLASRWRNCRLCDGTGSLCEYCEEPKEWCQGDCQRNLKKRPDR